jgi:integrase
MAKLRITKRSVEAMVLRESDYIVFDADLAGFGVRVMPSGKRFFLVQYRRHGRTRRVMIGPFGPVTAEEARRQALKLLGQAATGDDPADARDRLRQSMTLKELGERFMREHVEVRCKPSTQREYRRSVDLFLTPFFGIQRVRTVSRADVAEFHGSLSHIPYQANRSLATLSKMMRLSELWGLRDPHTNPCEQIEKYPERKRERFLSPREIARLGKALNTAVESGRESPHAVAAFRLLLLTGCRLGEIQTLQWQHVFLEECELRLPDSKTGAKTIYLGSAAVGTLQTIPRFDGNSFVIAGKNIGAHLTDLQHPWRRVRAAAGLPDVRIHDLRHTFASGGIAAGEGLPMIGKLLGHTQVQTTARYAHLASDPVKRAADKIAGAIAESLAA